MSLFDFFFPEIAQTEQLRRIADAASANAMQSRLSQARGNLNRMSAGKRIEELEAEVAQLSLMVEALVATLIESGATSREKLVKSIGEIDLMDGIADGRITAAPPPPKTKKGVEFNFPD